MKINLDEPFHELPHLSPNADIETKPILNQAIRANRELARLKGYWNCSLLSTQNL